jgi:hypothetical protein
MPIERPSAGSGPDPRWAQLPSLPPPTSEQLAELRQRIYRRWRARAEARRWLGPSLLLLLAIAGPHPDSSPFSLLSPSARAATSTPMLTIGPLASPILSVPTSVIAAPIPTPPNQAVAVSMPPRPRPPRPPSHSQEPKTESPALHPVDGETALLAAALHRLHREHDPSGTLALLSDYDQRFPRGELAAEVTLVQAEALLKLGRRDELVERLDPEIVGKYPRAPELALLRAEALAKLGRGAEALTAFSALLDGPLESQALERALFGRALCRAAVGRSEGARADLARLLAEFPSEKPKIARVLESLEP